MKKVLSVLLVIAGLILLAGCSLFGGGELKQAKFNDAFSIISEEVNPAANDINLNDYILNDSSNEYAYFQKDNNHIIYNLKTGISKMYQSSIKLKSTYYYIENQTNNEYITYAYTNQELKRYEKNSSIQFMSNTVLNGSVTDYYYKDGIHTSQDQSSLQNYDVEGETYQYKISNGTFTIYKNHQVAFIFKAPSYVETFKAYVLANGNVVYQYIYKDSSTSEKYDYLSSGNKFLLKTFIYDVKNGKSKEIEFEYVISYVNNELVSSSTFLRQGVKFKNKNMNIIIGSKIVDKRIDTTDSQWMLADGNLKLKSSINKDFKYMQAFLVPNKENIVIVTELLTYIINGNNKIKYTYQTEQITGINKKYLVVREMDSSNHVIFDLKTGNKTEGYTFVSLTSNVVFLSKNVNNKVEYFEFKDGSVTPLFSAPTSLSTDIYIIGNENSKNTLMVDGKVVLEDIEYASSIMTYRDEETFKTYRVIRVVKNNTVTHYRVVAPELFTS